MNQPSLQLGHLFLLFLTDCPIFEMYVVTSMAGTCELITNMTEYWVTNPNICYGRCLDTPGCRGVTYGIVQKMCGYHTCDCSTGTTSGFTFMWRYCLNSQCLMRSYNKQANAMSLTCNQDKTSLIFKRLQKQPFYTEIRSS